MQGVGLKDFFRAWEVRLGDVEGVGMKATCCFERPVGCKRSNSRSLYIGYRRIIQDQAMQI